MGGRVRSDDREQRPLLFNILRRIFSTFRKSLAAAASVSKLERNSRLFDVPAPPPIELFFCKPCTPNPLPRPLSIIKKKIKNPKKIEKFIIKETETDVIPEKKITTFFCK